LSYTAETCSFLDHHNKVLSRMTASLTYLYCHNRDDTH